ncbi:hypothetical protein CDIK_2195 [Cucumispora dikerogammari]|nr:hypothetical protein CDIK_2195 [Cucumispora dikerogammari]
MDSLKQNRLTNLQQLATILSKNCTLSEKEAHIICEQILFLQEPDYIFKNDQQITNAVIESSAYKEIRNVEIKFEMGAIEICPVGKIPIVFAATGKCGHIFEKNVLDDLRQRRLMCPIVGCGKDI